MVTIDINWVSDAVIAMDWVTFCRKMTEMFSLAALVARRPWLGRGRNADMAADDGPTAIGAKGGA